MYTNTINLQLRVRKAQGQSTNLKLDKERDRKTSLDHQITEGEVD